MYLRSLPRAWLPKLLSWDYLPTHSRQNKTLGVALGFSNAAAAGLKYVFLFIVLECSCYRNESEISSDSLWDYSW